MCLSLSGMKWKVDLYAEYEANLPLHPILWKCKFSYTDQSIHLEKRSRYQSKAGGILSCTRVPGALYKTIPIGIIRAKAGEGCRPTRRVEEGTEQLKLASEWGRVFIIASQWNTHHLQSQCTAAVKEKSKRHSHCPKLGYRRGIGHNSGRRGGRRRTHQSEIERRRGRAPATAMTP
ncbi:hypothetical protein CRG98_012421 [Punica granatum]|uniref:Uncharacterized protein n=1 Tax=Punica granatum TaxID=22663 RepID=A0A2I0KF92_PUNGR|nr:hypothetical protein CRG98_012421 [Punica granatum]